MSGGISALEGFDYQAIVALELMLQHFESHGLTAWARPEGLDDLDLFHEDSNGAIHRTLVQVKKPHQDSDGTRVVAAWGLGEVLEELLTPRWLLLQEDRTQLKWVLGDSLGEDAAALFGPPTDTAVWAARRAAAEWVVRARELAHLPAGRSAPGWRSPFHGGTRPEGAQGDAAQRWSTSFDRRATRAGLDTSVIKTWTSAIEAAHAVLDRSLDRVATAPAYAEAAALRERVTRLLATRFGLKDQTIEQVVFRNLRGFVDDVARARGTRIDLPKLEQEITDVWPRLVATVIPPPLPKPYLPRPAWVGDLARRCGAVIGPSGAGKTTSATELYDRLRSIEPDTAVLYAEVRSDTTLRNVLEGVVHAVGRRGEAAPYSLLPSIRAGSDEALLGMADALEGWATPVALLIDLVDGTASASLARDLARFAQRLPARPRTRLWVFGQEDALAELSDVERTARGLERVPAPGLDWEEFLTFAALHALHGRTELYPVYEALTSGRATGVAPRIADAVLSLGSVEAALFAARSEDVLLAADASRYGRLLARDQEVLGALACLTHPFRVEDAEAVFASLAVKAGVRAGIRAGLLHPLGDGRTEFHETVRRNVLAQQPIGVLRGNHAHLANVYAGRGERVLEAYHADEANLRERAREAGRAAFFNHATADRVAGRAMQRGWVSPQEVLAALRSEPKGPHGWWRALHDGLDDVTASALVTWWREVVGQRNAREALWSAPRALVSARPDLLPELLDIIAACAAEDGKYYGASALGIALRNFDFDQNVVLERFERATPNERRALAETMHASQAPQCIARWLAHVVEGGSAPSTPDNTVLSDVHALAIIDALPDTDLTQLIVRRDWGFGRATSFLWRHRDEFGATAARALNDDHLEPRKAKVALRLLGVAGDPRLLEAARRWGRRQGEAQSLALAAPLLIDERAWREELAALARDPLVDTSARVASYGVFVQSGDGGEALLGDIVRVSPDIEGACRLTAGLSFVMRPSLFALELLLAHVLRGDDQHAQRVVGTALGNATFFADGSGARRVAELLIPLLDLPVPELRMAVLHSLTMLRQPVARQACAKLALAAAGTAVGGMAAVAACASRPERPSDVTGAVEANEGQAWLLSVLAARLEDASAVPRLVREALDVGRSWAARRRALLSLKRLPHSIEVDEAIDRILAERSLLGALDSMHGQLSETVAGLIRDDTKLFVDLWRAGEARFVDIIGATFQSPDVLFVRATDAQIKACLTTVWRAVDRRLRGGAAAADVLSSVQEDILRSQVQVTALRVARTFGNGDVLERVMETTDSPWLAYQALLERANIDPRTPEDAARWARLVANGPCGADRALQGAVEHVLGSTRRKQSRPAPPRTDDDSGHRVLDSHHLHELLDKELKAPPHARLSDMSDDELASLVTRLHPADDNHVVEIPECPDDATRVSLTSTGATVRARGSRHTGRKGDRAGIRARLVARFPDRVPAEWLDGPRRGLSFVPKLVTALADEGDPARALRVLGRLPGHVTEVVNSADFYRLGRIADNALVEWAGTWSGSGGATEIRALAAFSRQATVDAVVPLLVQLMRRIEGHVFEKDAVIGHGVHDPWREAVVDLLAAARLPDVAGAAAWLVKMHMKTPSALMRMWVVDAMAAFPSTWSFLEGQALKVVEYMPSFQPDSGKLEAIAHDLFHSRRPADREDIA